MSRYLIVNADDFALDTRVNQGILWAYQHGILTSTSVLANGDAFAEGVDLLRENPGLGVGVHLSLVDGRPLHGQLDTLVDREGDFWQDYRQFFQRFLLGKIKVEEIKMEWGLQIRRVQETGLKITHLDSHQHLHIFPGLLSIALDLAEAFQIPCMRYPMEPFGQLAGGIPSLSRLGARNLLTVMSLWGQRKMRRIARPDCFFGMLWGGRLEEKRLLAMLRQLPKAGIVELMSHPGLDNPFMIAKTHWPYHWEEEKMALTSPAVADLLQRQDVQLIHYGDLAHIRSGKG